MSIRPEQRFQQSAKRLIYRGVLIPLIIISCVIIAAFFIKMSVELIQGGLDYKNSDDVRKVTATLVRSQKYHDPDPDTGGTYYQNTYQYEVQGVRYSYENETSYSPDHTVTLTVYRDANNRYQVKTAHFGLKAFAFIFAAIFCAAVTVVFTVWLWKASINEKRA